jgi:cysteinyl-tRNA synthetase
LPKNSQTQFVHKTLGQLLDSEVFAINSLTGQKEPIQRLNDVPLRVYTCGPTMYSQAHLGHARTYTSLDTIRRILTDYFKTPVTWCMNITDVEDKSMAAWTSGETGFDSP